MSELNIAFGTIVVDDATPAVWQKTSTTDNSAFNLLAGATITGNISVTGNVSAGGSILSSSPTGGVGYKAGAGGAVTQITSNATGVTLDTVTGQITTVAVTTAAGVSFVFSVTNTSALATDAVAVSTTYAGAGTPVVSVIAQAAGSFSIVVHNIHATAALNAAVVINFALIRGSND